MIDVGDISYPDIFAFLSDKSASKNIVYLNSPPKLERFAVDFSNTRIGDEDQSVIEVCEELSDFIHPDFRLIDCLKKGLVYHHGSLPDIVKLYIEDVFSKLPSVSHIITTSTLLEGVNIPAERLFVLETKKGRRNLTPSQFQNLVGRVCRFSEIFDPDNGSLKRLEPSIYLVKSEYCDSRANIESFIRKSVRVDKEIVDTTENVLLERTEIVAGENDVAKEEADRVLENLSAGITGVTASYAVTPVGRLCFVNNISEIDILLAESEMHTSVTNIPENSIEDPRDLLANIARIFIPHLKDASGTGNLSRLSNTDAQNFYTMFLRWRMRNASYNQMIANFLGYWETVTQPFVYVHKWGDTPAYDSRRDYWVDIRKKSERERVNLAIVRIKEEQDFVDNSLIKFIEILNDLSLLNEQMYLKIKYGTSDPRMITMINNGINNHLANVLLASYSDYVDIDVDRKTVDIRPEVIDQMEEAGENAILVFETEFHVRQ